ncbi:MAG: hypothetical protein K1X89_04090 [Myxococcaceae bacterium]|nr:hypothetical protein [Myxococcaceae bacterium]
MTVTLFARSLPCAFVLLGGAALAAGAPDAGRPAVVSAMRANFGALMTLQPYLASQARFADPGNAEEIAHQLVILRQTRHAFRAPPRTEEPGVAAMMALFDGYLSTAQDRFAKGAHEAARHQLQTATGFCLGCHTRVVVAKDYADLQGQVSSLELTPLERADLLAATRQFREALALYQELLAGPARGELAQRLLADAAKGALRITVVVHDDAQETVAWLGELTKRPELGVALRRDVEAWLKEAEAWRAEPAPAKDEPVAATVARARALLNAGGPLPGEVTLLRAGALLHRALAREPTGKSRGEALYLLGLSASGTPDTFRYELDQLYFEACIRENPHSELARRCHERLESNVTLAFTGSAGTSVPPELSRKLAALKAVAK